MEERFDLQCKHCGARMLNVAYNQVINCDECNSVDLRVLRIHTTGLVDLAYPESSRRQ